MANTEYANGCVGCVDHTLHNGSCDYLFNNGHCRPCKAVPSGGCELYTVVARPEGTEESRRTWDTEEARRLLAKGMPEDKAALKLNASINSLQVWIRAGMPAGTAAPRASETKKRGPKGVWNEEVYRKLYEEGLTDPEAAERMGLDPQTVWKRRKALGLPANGKKKKGV